MRANPRSAKGNRSSCVMASGTAISPPATLSSSRRRRSGSIASPDLVHDPRAVDPSTADGETFAGPLRSRLASALGPWSALAVPAVLAPLIGLLIGVAFHQSGSRQLLRAAPGTAVETRGQLLTLSYTLILFAPYNAYFLAFSPDWTFFYAIDTRSNLGLLIGLSLLLDCAS